MLAGIVSLFASIWAGLTGERGANTLDHGLFISVGILVGLVYFYISGSSLEWFWHDLLMFVSAFRL